MSSGDTTIRELLDGALEATGDDSAGLICFYQDVWDKWDAENTPVVRCGVDELPSRRFNHGFGGANGPALRAYSDRYVYFTHEYDGAESVRYVQRTTEPRNSVQHVC